jgi:hypothetical protein
METVKYQNLVTLTASIKLQDLSDYERERFWSQFYNRTERRLGWGLTIVGALGIAGSLCYELVCTAEVPVHLKVALFVTAVGLLLLLWNLLRLKWKTDHFDRYKGVMR